MLLACLVIQAAASLLPATMISSIEWVPAGVADPSPKKYEFSQAELELIEMMKDHNMNDLQDVQAHLAQQEKDAAKKKKSKKLTAAKMENTLPADLRMDEYSSDEDDDDGNENGAQIGQLLVEDVALEEEGIAVDDDYKARDDMDDSDEEDSDDDLADVPDTREYTPVDLEGLNAIGLSQIGTNAPAYMGGDDEDDDNDDEDSDADDVIIQPGDAIVVVAKTEDDFAALEQQIDHLQGTKINPLHGLKA